MIRGRGGDNAVGLRAPEFPSGMTWLNSESLTMAGLTAQKKVTLVDFWTYSCVNCIRTLPHLVEWDKRYREHGLFIVGVHTPEFEFEKDIHNIKHALKKFSIGYPVVVDSDYKIWNLWSNHVWPRKFLVSHEGIVVYDHSGEGGYRESEQEIQKALRAAQFGAQLPELSGMEDPREGGGVCYPATPETYLGYERGHAANAGGLKREQSTAYQDSGGTDPNTWFLQGEWGPKGEYVQHARVTGTYEDYLRLNYQALSVNIVAASTAGEQKVKVTLDDAPVPPGIRGPDVREERGETFLYISEPELYSVVSSRQFHGGSLKLWCDSGAVQLFAFTFSGCEGIDI
jgi:thiol-disulfide isomerase/thioredoxin